MFIKKKYFKIFREETKRGYKYVGIRLQIQRKKDGWKEIEFLHNGKKIKEIKQKIITSKNF